MTWVDPCLQRSRNAAGDLVVRLGMPQLDTYLEFLAALYLHLADDWLACQYRRAAEAIDAQMLPGKPAALPDPSTVDGETR